ncbi:MAG: HEAT repeat domain-containing protein [Planctomycetota bacterium]|jgi:hypothetical protein
MRRFVIIMLGIGCALGLFADLASADKVILKGEHPALGGIQGKIISGAKPGEKPGEVIRTGDEVEVLIIINNYPVGTMWLTWDRIASIEFSMDNGSSYKVDEDLRKKQERDRDRSEKDYDEWLKDEKEKSKEKGEEKEGEAKKEEKEKPEFMPDEEKQIDIWIAQLGLGSQRHAGRRRHAKAKLVEQGKKVVSKVSVALNTSNKLLKRNAAGVLGEIGTDAEAGTEALIAAAKDDDKFVRFEVIEALRKITGEDFGYKWESSIIEQRRAVKKWEQWWQAEKKKKEAAEEEKKEDSSSSSGGAGRSFPK